MVGPLTFRPFAVNMLLGMVIVTAPGWSQEPPAVEPPPIQRMDTASDQFASAKRAKSATRGLKGEARIRQMRAAARAYAAVPTYWPQNGKLVAEANYRRGEILRSIGESGAARGAFEEVLEVAVEGSDFAVRALLEIGHLCRRARQHEDALRFYRQARDRKEVSLRYNNDGREWLARTCLRILDWDAAEAAAIDWAEHAEGPVEEVKAHDLRILALVGSKQLVAAERLLQDLRARFAVLAAAPTKEGAALKKSLERMKAPRTLEKARSNGR